MNTSEVDLKSKKVAHYSLFIAIFIFLSTIGVKENWGLIGLFSIIYAIFAFRWMKTHKKMFFCAMALNFISFCIFVGFYFL